MEKRTEVLIVGAGPGGLQLGHYLQQKARSYLILERDEPGAFFRAFPRHEKLLSINKVNTGIEDSELNLRWDWNSLLREDRPMPFRDYSEDYFPLAKDLVRYLQDFGRTQQEAICQGVEVKRIRRRKQMFVVTDQKKRTTCADRLVMATGVSQPCVPKIPGIEHAELYGDVSVDPADFRNQRVLVIGKGNSGFETADNLIGAAAVIHIASPHPLRMAWETKYVGDLRAINNSLIDTYQLKSQNAILDARCERIERRNGCLEVDFAYTHAAGERETLVYDRVICCTGFRFDTGPFDKSCTPHLLPNQRFPQQTSAFESVNVPGLYFAGTLMQARDFKKKQSGFIHGFRYNIRALHRILESRYHGCPWPSREVRADAGELTSSVLGRLNRSSALWQQPGFLCDVLRLPEDHGPARYYEELPVAYVQDGGLGPIGRYCTVTLEFGEELIARSANVLAIDRVNRSDVAGAALSAAIHPVVRLYDHGALVSVHHVLEDLEGRWVEDVHVKPLRAYLFDTIRAPSGTRAGAGIGSGVHPNIEAPSEVK